MNGYMNWETWNIALWINNDESLYRAAHRYANQALKPTYEEFIFSIGYEDSRTPDGADWLSHAVDHKDLDDFILELVDTPCLV
jgi:hypothetical protein